MRIKICVHFKFIYYSKIKGENIRKALNIAYFKKEVNLNRDTKSKMC